MGLTLLSLFLTAGSPGLPVYDLSNWAQILLLGGKERQNFRFRKKFQFYTGMTVSAKLQGRDLSDRGTHFLLLQFSISKEEQIARSLSNKWPSRCCPFSQQDVLVWPDRRTLMISLAGWAEILVGEKIDNFFKLSTFLFQLLLQWGVLPWCFKPLSNKTGRNKWLKAADHRYLINVKRTSWVLSNSLQNWRLHASLQREIFHIFSALGVWAEGDHETMRGGRSARIYHWALG